MNKAVIERHGKLFGLAAGVCNRLNLRNSLCVGKNNALIMGIVMLKGLKIDVHGKNNSIVIEDFSRLKNCSIYIHGDNNKIYIGKKNSLNNTDFYVEDSGNTIWLGDNTTISGKTHFAAIEGTAISIGEDCMFSSEIHFTTGDSHSIVDLENRRINPSQDIKIGNHVWVGTKVTCLKNSEVANNCIVGATSTLNGKYLKSNCVIAGVPAKVVKEDINWLRERI